MNDALVVKSKLFVQNRDILKTEFKWASSNMVPLCAYMYAKKGIKVDAVRINECKQIIKKHIGVFSKVKGDAFYPLATALSLENSKEKAFARRVEVYKKLKEKFGSAIYMPWIAFAVGDYEKEHNTDIDKLIQRSVELEEMINNEFLDKKENKLEGIAVLLILSGKTNQEIIRDLKIAYEFLCDTKISKEAIPALSYMLVAGTGEIEDSCEKALSSYEIFLKSQCKFEKEAETAVLGLLANSKQKQEEYIKDVIDVNEFLAEQKGFDIINVSSHERHMYAGLLAAQDSSAVEEQIAVLIAMESALNVAIFD